VASNDLGEFLGLAQILNVPFFGSRHIQSATTSWKSTLERTVQGNILMLTSSYVNGEVGNDSTVHGRAKDEAKATLHLLLKHLKKPGVG